MRHAGAKWLHGPRDGVLKLDTPIRCSLTKKVNKIRQGAAHNGCGSIGISANVSALFSESDVTPVFQSLKGSVVGLTMVIDILGA